VSIQNEPTKFKLTPINRFDARRGYKRCSVPGVGVAIQGRRQTAVADFWLNPEGTLVVRFTCGEADIHFAASEVFGDQIKDCDLDEFGEFVSDTLYEWIVEGTPDLPSSIYESLD
jgi:hypothetical protein